MKEVQEAMDGVYGATSSYDRDGGYSKKLAEEVNAGIRTGLDSFSDAEAYVLDNHGYLLADAALKRHVPTLSFRDWLGDRSFSHKCANADA